MIDPVLEDPTVLKSDEVLFGRRKQEKVLRKSVNRAGEIGQYTCAVLTSFEFRPRKLVVVIPEMETVPMPRFAVGRLLMASICPLLEYVASNPPWNEWLRRVQLSVFANCISGLELNLGFCRARAKSPPIVGD